MKLTGIEIAPEAITCAKQSAQELGLQNLHFQALDSTQFATAQGEVPDLVLVNPPRRGIGKPLCDFLSRMAPRFTPAVMHKPWRRISTSCLDIALNASNFLICSHIPRITKC